MVRRFVRAALVENLGLKALSLALAVGLFVFVRAGRAVESTVSLDVRYKLPADRVLMTSLAPHVRVTVRGPWARLSHLSSSDFKAPLLVDLASEPSGEYHFRPELVSLPRGMELVSISPASIRVDFEPRVVRAVPIEVKTQGTPDPGWEVERITSDPSTVLLSGAQSVVSGLRAVETMPVLLAGVNESFTREVSLAPPPRHTEYPTQGQVRVSVTVAKIRKLLHPWAPPVPPQGKGKGGETESTKPDGGSGPEAGKAP